jgi:hypothetical protein
VATEDTYTNDGAALQICPSCKQDHVCVRVWDGLDPQRGLMFCWHPLSQIIMKTILRVYITYPQVEVRYAVVYRKVGHVLEWRREIDREGGRELTRPPRRDLCQVRAACSWLNSKHGPSVVRFVFSK